jgi:polyisoprenoid-binding protein YceI
MDTPSSPKRRRLVIALASVVALVALGYGAIIFYAEVINDAPEALDSGDLDAALAATTTAVNAEPADEPADEAPATTQGIETTTETITETSVVTDTEEASPTDETDLEGVWVIGPGSELGYRVAEVLFGVPTEGVGRTDQVTGSIRLDGDVLAEASFTVDVASITSDDGRRDNQFRGRIMSANEFPTATFTLTAPAELGVEAAEGASVTAAVTGDLTLRGVTLPVEVAVEARITDGRLGVLGSVPVVFTDFGITDPSITGIRVEPDGLIEFVLVLDPA